jgi:cytochrome P450
VTALLKDRRLDTSIAEQSFTVLPPEQLAALEPLRRCVSLWMGHTTTDGHRRFQMLLKRYFTPAAMEKWRPNVRRIAEDLIDKVIADGRMEVVADLAIPLPANVIADMLGMPVEDRPILRVWSQSVLKVFTQSGVRRPAFRAGGRRRVPALPLRPCRGAQGPTSVTTSSAHCCGPRTRARSAPRRSCPTAC